MKNENLSASMSLTEGIKRKAIDLGFDLAGITDASPIDAEQVEFLAATESRRAQVSPNYGLWAKLPQHNKEIRLKM
ncbi:MAG: hypothetical protein ACYS83_05400 [Planctomycetota bacterium]|jgi:hypothetical protein